MYRDRIPVGSSFESGAELQVANGTGSEVLTRPPEFPSATRIPRDVGQRRSQELPVAEVEESVGGDGLGVGHNIQRLPVPRVYHRLDLVFWYPAILSPL